MLKTEVKTIKFVKSTVKTIWIQSTPSTHKIMKHSFLLQSAQGNTLPSNFFSIIGNQMDEISVLGWLIKLLVHNKYVLFCIFCNYDLVQLVQCLLPQIILQLSSVECAANLDVSKCPDLRLYLCSFNLVPSGLLVLSVHFLQHLQDNLYTHCDLSSRYFLDFNFLKMHPIVFLVLRYGFYKVFIRIS
jgi:hypothetical protein